MKYSFKNDYNQIASTKYLNKLLEYSNNQYDGYQFDEETNKLRDTLKQKTSFDVDCYIIAGGTLCNVVGLSKMLKSYEAIICVDTGHINVHETGAVEATGHKILTVNNVNGKLLPSSLLELLSHYGDPHMVKPKVVYISNSTELGTVYTKEELSNLYKVCKENDLYLFIDGARLPHAMSAASLSLKDITQYSDMYYIGGTKNGMPYGELLVIKDDELKKEFLYHQKNHGSLLAKSYVLSIMFNESFKDDYYLTLAKHANSCKTILEEGVKSITFEDVIVYANSTNQLFLRLDNVVIDKLSKLYSFEIWEQGSITSVIRLVTSFNTDVLKCHEFVEDLRLILTN